MRAYFFSNSYLHGMQHGIQAAHVIGEMWAKYANPHSVQFQQLFEFSTRHKTFIILNGGDHTALSAIANFIGAGAEAHHHEYSFAKFYEPGLNDALTSVGIILPERMYNAQATEIGRALNDSASERSNPSLYTPFYTPWEQEFLSRVSLCKLA